MTEFFRFPHTPHIAWLGSGAPRDDKVLSPAESHDFLAHDVIVEEKVDGANLGFSLGLDGELRAQNRGSYLDLDAPAGQWKPLKRWVSERRHALQDALAPDLMLFGEWCFAVHSISYVALPDWFLAFDVYDRASGRFWSVERRNALVERLGLARVPERARGRVSLADLQRMLGVSELGEGPAEGLYLRREVGGHLVARAKLVRAEFVQAMGEHWSRQRLVENRLAASRADPPA